MLSDRIFQIAFLISVITHSVILFQNLNLDLLSVNKKGQNNIEVSYIKSLKEPPEKSRTLPPKKEPFLKLSPKITLEKRIPPPFIDKENIFKKNKEIIPSESIFNKPSVIKPDIVKLDIIAIKKRIELPPVDMDKVSNPSYISYYQIVREKIKRAAYQNYTRTEVGDIYISFVIFNDGYLKEIRLMEEKSSSNPYLREIALKSIKDASPFPNFPKELDYPQLSFNVVISFEIE